LAGPRLAGCGPGGFALGVSRAVTFDASLDGVAVEGVLGLRHDHREGVGLGGGKVREDLAVQVYLGEPEAVDELRVGQPVLASAGVDALDPQRPEIALALLAVRVGVDAALPDLLLGPLVRALLGPRYPLACSRTFLRFLRA
jgi:hypothetical protein